MKTLITTFILITTLSCARTPDEQRLASLTRDFYEIPDFFFVEVIGLEVISEVNDKEYRCFEYKLDVNLKAKEDLLTLRPARPFGKYKVRTTRGEEFIAITSTREELEKEIKYYEDQIDKVAIIKQCVRMRGKRCLKYRKVRASKTHKEKVINRQIATTKKFFPFKINKNQNTIVEELPIVICKNELTDKWN